MSINLSPCHRNSSNTRRKIHLFNIHVTSKYENSQTIKLLFSKLQNKIRDKLQNLSRGWGTSKEVQPGTLSGQGACKGWGRTHFIYTVSTHIFRKLYHVHVTLKDNNLYCLHTNTCMKKKFYKL